MQNILDELTSIFRQVFTNPTLQISLTTDASEIEDWDSLQHIILVLTIEKHFNIKFTTTESQKFNNVQELVNSIEKSRESNR